MSQWVQLDSARLRNVGGRSKNRIVMRVFGENKKPFPRIVLSVWHNPYDDTYRLTISRKEKPGEWWAEVGMPRELLPHAQELLCEAIAKLQKEDGTI